LLEEELLTLLRQNIRHRVVDRYPDRRMTITSAESAGPARVSKDLDPTDATLADWSEWVGPAIVGEVGGTRREARLEVLDVEQREKPRVLLEVVERVLTCR
jgi:hypothetical protein